MSMYSYQHMMCISQSAICEWNVCIIYLFIKLYFMLTNLNLEKEIRCKCGNVMLEDDFRIQKSIL